MSAREKKRARALVVDEAADQMFVRVPLPPELVALVRKHVDRAGGLFEMGRGVFAVVMGSDEAARAFMGECVAAGTDLATDVKRVRKAMDGRRARRRPSRK